MDNSSTSLKFIRDVQSIRPLMLAALDQGTENAIPRIDVEVTFRTDRPQERGGEKVIDWSFQIGGQEIDFRATNPQGTWQVGAPIMVNFRWAQDAESLPIPDPRKPSLSVSDFTATYSYVGRWSLIRLIKGHSVYQGDYRKISGPRPQVLEFQIPTAFNPECYRGDKPLPIERRSEEAKVYLRVALKEPGKIIKGAKDNVSAQKATLLSVPIFPVEAPLLEVRPNQRSRRE
jgi:type VI secretion system protein ImpL